MRWWTRSMRSFMSNAHLVVRAVRYFRRLSSGALSSIWCSSASVRAFSFLFDQSRDIIDAVTSWHRDVININSVYIGDVGLILMWIHINDIGSTSTSTWGHWCEFTDVNPMSPMWTKLTLMTSQRHDIPASLISRDWSKSHKTTWLAFPWPNSNAYLVITASSVLAVSAGFAASSLRRARMYSM